MKYLMTFFLTTISLQTLFSQEDNFREKVAEVKRKKLIQTLELSKEKQADFFKVYDDYRDRRRELQKERRELMNKLSHMAAISDEISVDKITSVISEVNALDKSIIAEREKVIASVKPILTSGQLAKFVLFEQNFAYKLREMIFDIKMDKHGPPPRFFMNDEDWPD